jgi:uncharacterized membrane protein
MSAGNPLLCNIEALSGCNEVAQSSYSYFFGVPLADFGVLFYGLLFIVVAVELMYSHVYFRRGIQILAAIGFIASAYFIFLQTSVINAFCVYCVASALFSLLIFILAYFIEPLGKEPRPLSMPAPQKRSRLILPPPHV